ncbi:histidine kinase [Lagierella sp.]|uniref:histidine kinase n=1 Tax=Lagierella sp. TaxID=2849657 RepID=UPI0026266BBF|nr:histidine kinase [Lagierella sp.]
MGILFNDSKEISKKVEEIFGDTSNYLIAIKHNDVKKGLAKLLISNLFYTLDSNRTYILFFDEKGVHEKEISNTTSGSFVMMPWHEIESFDIKEKNDKVILELSHLGKRMGYEIPFTGRLFNDNKENFINLKSNNFNKIL